MTSFRYSHPEREAIDAAAAEWLVVHDRGLNAEEAREFARWLNKSPLHAQAWSEAQIAWSRLDRIADLPPELVVRGADWQVMSKAPAVAPEPKLSVQRWKRRWLWSGMAAAVALTAITVLWNRQHPSQLLSNEPSLAKVETLAPRQITLPDGSVVELNADSEIAEEFTRAERHVRLVKGEAHFKVTKDALRPFVVDANGVGVKAVGTAFNVKLRPSVVEVLVTEGTVRVENAHAGAVIPRITEEIAAENTFIDAGNRAVIPLSLAANAAFERASVSADDLRAALAWQAVRLKFADMPLDRVASEFNRYNSTQLIVEESARDVVIAGTFRADNVTVFVGFMENAFGLSAERLANGTIVIRRSRS